jgi:hypothetical protein
MSRDLDLRLSKVSDLVQMPGVFTDFTPVERLSERIMLPQHFPAQKWGEIWGGKM